MKNRASPFAQCGDKTYLVANFQLEPSDNLPHLHELLAELLTKHDPADILLLRPLSPVEAAELEQSMDDAEVDFWAHLVGSGSRK